MILPVPHQVQKNKSRSFLDCILDESRIKYNCKVQKFNPFHDLLGRFTSPNGATGGGGQGQRSKQSDLEKQSSSSIRKGIRSLEKRIEGHREKLKHPELYTDEWEERPEKYKKGLYRHWRHEIQKFQESIERSKNELRRRGEHDGTGFGSNSETDHRKNRK